MSALRFRLRAAVLATALAGAAFAAFAATAPAATVHVSVDCAHSTATPIHVGAAAGDTIVFHMDGTTCAFDDGWELSNVNGHFDGIDMTGSPKVGPDGFGLSSAPGYLRFVSTTGDNGGGGHGFIAYLYTWPTLSWTTGTRPEASPFGPVLDPRPGSSPYDYADWYVWGIGPGSDWTVTAELLPSNGVALLADGAFIAQVDNVNFDAPGYDSANPKQIALVIGLGATQDLTVTKAGTGSGVVASDPAGIDCRATCTAGFAEGSVVTLTAAAAAGSTFAGWSGACSGTGTCTVTMAAAKAVTATFDAVAPTSLAPASLAPGSAAAASGSHGKARVVISAGARTRGIAVDRDGGVRLRLACPAGEGACDVSGTFSLPGASRRAGLRTTLLGTFSQATIESGRVRTVFVQLSMPTVLSLQRASSSRVVGTVLDLRTTRSGVTVQSRQAVKLRLPRAAPVEPVTG